MKIVWFILLINMVLFGESGQGEDLILKTADPLTFRVIVPINDQGASTGTGFIINKEGYFITNNHVIAEGKKDKIIIKNKFHEYLDVEFVKTYPKKDIAILKIKNYTDGKFLLLQKPETIKKRTSVVSLGFPSGGDLIAGFTYDSNIGEGVVSASEVIRQDVRSNFPTGYILIRHSAPVNKGNSGGPLLSSQATVVGINTLKNNDVATLTEDGEIIQGIFWSIHVSELIKVLDENRISYELSDQNLTLVSQDSPNNDLVIAIVAVLLLSLLLSFLAFKKKTQKAEIDEREISEVVRKKMNKYNDQRPLQMDHHILSDQGYPSPVIPEKTEFLSIKLRPDDHKLPMIEVKSRQKITVGRSRECDVVIEDEYVSREHLKLTLKGKSLEIENLTPSNGTYIDGKKIDHYQTAVLHKGQRLIMGSKNVVYTIA